MPDLYCIKRHPIHTVKCLKAPDHKGAHVHANVTWTDQEAQQILAILTAAYGGIVSWPPEDRRRDCGICHVPSIVRRCSCCERDLCHMCLYKENCPHSTDNHHALPVERPMV